MKHSPLLYSIEFAGCHKKSFVQIQNQQSVKINFCPVKLGSKIPTVRDVECFGAFVNVLGLICFVARGGAKS
jgi:hypothetical protein